MAGRPAPRPKGTNAKAPTKAAHSVSPARQQRRVAESQKWNKGTVTP